MKKNIKFENAQQLKQQYPDTFYAPDKEELKQLKPGDQVKVCTLQERFWAEVISIEKEVITARVDNMLLTRQLKYNDIISFHPDNIYNILPQSHQVTTLNSSKRVPKIQKPGNKTKGKKL